MISKLLVIIVLSTISCEIIFGAPISNSSSSPIKCGIADRPKDHYGFFPWMVMLEVIDVPYCTGTIVSANYVMTAGHCSEDADTVGFGSSNYELAQKVKIVEKHTYKGYHLRHLNEPDIALFKLEHPLELDGVTMAPICVGGKFEFGQQATIAGWGYQSFPTGVDSKGYCLYRNEEDLDVMTGQVKIVKSEECVNADGTHEIKNETIQICTKGGDSEIEHGDSGGPLMVQYENGQWHQIGITSYEHCHYPEKDRYDPAVYLYVNYYCDWIKETTGGEVSC